MRTSEEVYHRIRWDPRFDPARFVMGIGMRGAAPKRMPLPSFVPGGDIPWHRVLFFEADGEVVWDRSTGRDLIDSSKAGRAREARLLGEPFFAPRTPIAWSPSSAAWRPAEDGPASAAALRVLTWNTLWDRYDGDRIDTARRRPLLLEALRRADADVIALQEVEPELLGMLLRTPWIRDAYTVSTGPSGRDVADYGLVLLSRLPVMEAGRRVLGPHKAVDAITVTTAAGPLVVAVTHLTSDHTDDSAARRTAELTRLAEVLGGVDAPLLLLGDLNDGGDGPTRALGLRDAWTEIHGPADTTPTFDPTVNPLAAVSSLSGRSSRLDRVLLRGPDLHVTDATLLGDTPATPDGLFVSDHYGVLADVTFEQRRPGILDVRPTARTAVAWIPPADLWPPLQRIREAHDPSFHRWPPHVNLLFGFVPESSFEEAAPLLAEAAAAVAPFTAVLDGIRFFAHRHDSTAWLDPAAGDPAPWAALRHALERAFPHCRGRAEGHTPHLTLGRTRTPATWTSRPRPMSAQVGELVLLSRRGDEPMRPRATVTLGTGELRWPDHEPPAPDRLREALPEGVVHPAEPRRPAWAPPGSGLDPDDEVSEVADRLREALPEGVVHLVGSRRLGCALPGADLDLVAALPGSPGLSDLEARVRGALPGVAGLRRVIGARVPGLRMAVGALSVDLLVVATGNVPPAEAVARRTELDEPSAVSLSAVSDADAVRAAAGPGFPGLARQVKAWARARGLDSAPFGGLPGLAWSVLAARTSREAPGLPPGELLRHFFGAWASWDWRHAISLDPEVPGSAGPSDPPVRIMTPSAPVRPCTEQVGEGMRDLLTQELYTAWEILESGSDAGLVSPPPMHRRHAAWAVVTVHADEPDGFEATLGRVRGRMRTLLTDLEDAGAHDAHAWPRPFAAGSGLARFAVGLGRTPPDAATISRLSAPWTKGLHGVDVVRQENGQVPTLR